MKPKLKFFIQELNYYRDLLEILNNELYKEDETDLHQNIKYWLKARFIYMVEFIINLQEFKHMSYNEQEHLLKKEKIIHLVKYQ